MTGMSDICRAPSVPVSAGHEGTCGGDGAGGEQRMQHWEGCMGGGGQELSGDRAALTELWTLAQLGVAHREGGGDSGVPAAGGCHA